MSKDFLPQVFWPKCYRVFSENRVFFVKVFLLFSSMLVLNQMIFDYGVLKPLSSILLEALYSDLDLDLALQSWWVGVRPLIFLGIFDFVIQGFLLFLVLLKCDEFFNARFEISSRGLLQKTLYWTFVKPGLVAILVVTMIFAVAYLYFGPLFVFALPIILTPAIMVKKKQAMYKTVFEVLSYKFMKGLGVYFFPIFLALSSILAILVAGDLIKSFLVEIKSSAKFWFYIRDIEIKHYMSILESLGFVFLDVLVITCFGITSTVLVDSLETQKQRLTPQI